MAISSNLNNSMVEDHLSGNFNLFELNDVNNSATPTSGHVLVGNGSEWNNQLLSANVAVQVDAALVGTQPILNFINAASTTISAVDNGGATRIDISFNNLLPSNNLSDVVATQTALTNLIDTSNNINTTGRIDVNTLKINDSFYYSVNEQAIVATLNLTQDAGTAQSRFLQVLDADGAAATTDVVLPAPGAGGNGLSFFIVNDGAVENLDVKDAGLVSLTVLTPGQQVQVVYLETSASWLIV